MSRLAAAEPARAVSDLLQWRGYGLALLPLALAGVLPPVQVTVLCAVYALGLSL